MQQAAFQQLLPVLLQAAASLGADHHAACLQRLLKQCLEMVQQPIVPRRMGLAVLLQYWSDWQLQPPSAAACTDAADGSIPAASHQQLSAGSNDSSNSRSNSTKGSSTGADTSSQDCSQQFWRLVRVCLVDEEPLNRKRALRLLQLLLPKAQLQAQPQWGVFLALYELLDEFTPHLLKASWPTVSSSQRPCA
jgi:hypothetical protein